MPAWTVTGGFGAKNVDADGGIYKDDHQADEDGVAHWHDCTRDRVDNVPQLARGKSGPCVRVC